MIACAVEWASKTTITLKRTNEDMIITTTALESRNDEQAATDRNQVFEQSNVEFRLAQGTLRAEREPDSRRSMFVEPRFISPFCHGLDDRVQG